MLRKNLGNLKIQKDLTKDRSSTFDIKSGSSEKPKQIVKAGFSKYKAEEEEEVLSTGPVNTSHIMPPRQSQYGGKMDPLKFKSLNKFKQAIAPAIDSTPRITTNMSQTNTIYTRNKNIMHNIGYEPLSEGQFAQRGYPAHSVNNVEILMTEYNQDHTQF